METSATETPDGEKKDFLWLPQIGKYPGLAELGDGGCATQLSIPMAAAGLCQYSICRYIFHRPANFGPLSVFAQPIYAYTFYFKPSPLIAICNINGVSTLALMACTWAGYNYRESAFLTSCAKYSDPNPDRSCATRTGRTTPYRQRDEAGARKWMYIGMAIMAEPAVRVGLRVSGVSRVLTPLGLLAIGAFAGNGLHAGWTDFTDEDQYHERHK
ncbi:hypothetical protein E2P81_ATG00108 [Venturia nashicola]|uniref:Uncharacterized protein n=1 Tax=Venturia nashicola TaxID=86259 RepID=A0A4Z1PSS7_9PEZI|nr:hypothetical protein E6O75_ATG00115 [Venturia nashicola]TLD39121.1 hypothetical protein E2P81_ATG00108 [Venturia nashicola]